MVQSAAPVALSFVVLLSECGETERRRNDVRGACAVASSPPCSVALQASVFRRLALLVSDATDVVISNDTRRMTRHAADWPRVAAATP